MTASIRRWLRLCSVVVLLVLSITPGLLSPRLASADTDLVLGEEAVIGRANGDRVRLRQAPDPAAPVLAEWREGRVLRVVDGPLPAPDGSLWYQVHDERLDPTLGEPTRGFIVASFLLRPQTYADLTGQALETVLAAQPVPGDGLIPAPVEEVVPTEAPPPPTVESIVEEPVVEEPVIEEPVVTEPVVEEPIEDEPVVEEPVSDEPAGGAEPAADAQGGVQAAVQAQAEEVLVTAAATMQTRVALNLRSGPGTSYAVLTVMPAGAAVQTTGLVQDGFHELSYQGTVGWAASEYLQAESSPAPAAPSGSGTSAQVIDGALNLRAQPSTSSAVLAVMPDGASVQVLGSAENGFYPVRYNGTTGWAYGEFLNIEGQAVPTATATASPSSPPSGTVVGTATTTAPLNLRSGPGLTNGVILVIPFGSEVSITGSIQNGYYPVRFNGTNGWVSGDYLTLGGSNPTPSPSPSPTPGQTVGTATTMAPLNLRSGPGLTNSVLTVMPQGAQVSITGSIQNGYYPVRYNGTNGWASEDYLNLGGSSPSPTPSPTTPPGQTIDTATTTAPLNLRSGPGLTNSVILVIPFGAEVSITGSVQNGYYPVRFNGTNGWVSGDFLNFGGAPSPTPTTSPTPSGPGQTVDTAWTTANLNLRSGPSLTNSVLLVIPFGAEVDVTGSVQSGYYPVRYNGTNGWASADFLTFEEPGQTPGPGPGSGTGSGIVWPVRGSTWEITQGYNGFSHYNGSGGFQYHYSFDIARVDRATAGQPVYAPASGSVRWTERASGGIVINMGNGYAVAMFHLTVDRKWVAGAAINQGDYIGTVSGPGGEGFVDFSHIHFTVWQSTDGGNWSRNAVPFTGINAISGMNFPDIGGTSQWQGTRFTP